MLKSGTRHADAWVTGPARSLLLTLTRRLPLADREAAGCSPARARSAQVQVADAARRRRHHAVKMPL